MNKIDEPRLPKKPLIIAVMFAVAMIARRLPYRVNTMPLKVLNVSRLSLMSARARPRQPTSFFGPLTM